MYIVSGAAIWLIDNKMDRSAMMTMIDEGPLQETTDVRERVIREKKETNGG